MKKLLFAFLPVFVTLFGAADICASEKQGKEPVKPALLVIDIQNEYLQFIPEHDKTIGLRMINGAIWMFRQYGYPVIRVYNTDPKWGPEPGSEAFSFPASVNVTDDDPMVVKNYANAFKKTDLKKLLDEKDCNTVILCGLSAVGCVLATYFGAADVDLNVMMIKDAVMSHNSGYTDSVEAIFDTVSFDTLELILKAVQE